MLTVSMEAQGTELELCAVWLFPAAWAAVSEAFGQGLLERASSLPTRRTVALRGARLSRGGSSWEEDWQGHQEGQQVTPVKITELPIGMSWKQQYPNVLDVSVCSVVTGFNFLNPVFTRRHFPPSICVAA